MQFVNEGQLLCEIWNINGGDHKDQCFLWHDVEGIAVPIQQKVQAGSSKMLVNLYHSTQCHIPKDNNLQDVTVYLSWHTFTPESS